MLAIPARLHCFILYRPICSKTASVYEQVFLTHATGDYDRCNEDVDPVAASAEYELEKRIEHMDIVTVQLNKGTVTKS